MTSVRSSMAVVMLPMAKATPCVPTVLALAIHLLWLVLGANQTSGEKDISAEFNWIADYLADAWTPRASCMSCEEDRLSLDGLKEADFPSILIGLFVEQPTPFIDGFFDSVAKLNYPKSGIDLFVHNKETYHHRDVITFLEAHGQEYRSVLHIPPTSNVSEVAARNWATEECLLQGCQYYFMFDAVARLEDPHTLTTLIQLNRTIVSPMLTLPYSVTKKANFWRGISADGVFAPTDDMLDIVRCTKNGTSFERVLAPQKLYKMARLLKEVRRIPLCHLSFKTTIQGHFIYITNHKRYGRLVTPALYQTHHLYNDVYNIIQNPFEWEQKFLHRNYSDTLKNDDLEMPCPGVFWFPIVNEVFCDQMVEIAEASGLIVNGSNRYDARVEGGRDLVPTVDVDIDQLEFDRQWKYLLNRYIRPLQKKAFPAFTQPEEDTTFASFISRYTPSEQAGLREHVDDSTFTVNIALNHYLKDFEGGGCRFINSNCSVTKTRKGWMLVHPGEGVWHTGLPVTSGVRYILVSFVDP